ncbi:MAG: S-methyl-5-thioribose-1-phosphate isomerase [Nitrososphaerota archaeon]|nr:S-methyl-5-thioribose-1-phosphate isomerase [Nitrososphaerota archaeon]MDG6939555.1 S-methyl-5-thioribose-1-phosphate isomerase [Nitrososphaerota archaeon]
MRPLLWEGRRLSVLDQRLLPTRVKWVGLRTAEDAFSAIAEMKVRGAPLIGVVGAFGLALEAGRMGSTPLPRFREGLERVASRLVSARPTAVNLKWAVDRCMDSAARAGTVPEAKEALMEEAEWIMAYEERTARRLGEIGERLIRDGDTVMTHCNAGSLATVDYGTALSPIRVAIEKGKKVKVVATETRPALQGARLTALELQKDGIDTTLISDTMVGYAMSQGMVDLVMLGADRVLRDGHVINKIGTYQVATMASRHSVPFYSVFPWSTVDMKTEKEGVRIEQRSPKEVEFVRGRRVAPKGIKVFNPAFDITPPELVTGLVTERGIILPPFYSKLEEADGAPYEAVGGGN